MTREEEKYTTLDTELCKWWVNTLFNTAKEKACNSHNFDDAEEIQSAQDKIIKALEQEPSGDLISRQAVNNLQRYRYNCGETSITCVSLTDVNELPPVTPQEPKTGHWINRRIIANTSIDMIVCSECGQEFSYDAETGISISDYNYCPNCGARMERGGVGNDSRSVD